MTTPSGSLTQDLKTTMMRPAAQAEAVGAPSPREGKGGRNLRRLAVHGSLWVIGSLLVIQISKVCSNIVLARLLSPEIFGLTTLAAVIVTGLHMLSDVGVGSLIIQHHRGDDPRFLNTVWTIQVFRGLLIAALLALIAVPISRLYQDSRLAMILILMGGVAMVDGFNSTSLYTLKRNLKVRQNCTLSVQCQVVMVGATILAALISPTVWAIILGGYVQTIFRLIASHRLNRDVPNRFCWDSESSRALFSFGKWIFVSTAITFFANQTDRLLLGRLGSLEALGIYGLALTVATMPQMLGGQLAQVVLYPLFANQAREDLSQLERKVLLARRVVLSAGLVSVLATMVLSPWFFKFLYDERYATAGWLAQLLCVYTWFSGLQLSADRVLLAVGDTRSLALSNAVNVVVTVLGCIGGHWLGGLLGFTIGLCLSTLAGHIVIQVALARHGIHILLQDVVYTTLMLAMGTVGALGPRLVASFGEGEPSLGVSLMLGLPPLAVTGGWSLCVAWKVVLKR